MPLLLADSYVAGALTSGLEFEGLVSCRFRRPGARPGVRVERLTSCTLRTVGQEDCVAQTCCFCEGGSSENPLCAELTHDLGAAGVGDVTFNAMCLLGPFVAPQYDWQQCVDPVNVDVCEFDDPLFCVHVEDTCHHGESGRALAFALRAGRGPCRRRPHCGGLGPCAQTSTTMLPGRSAKAPASLAWRSA